MSDQLDDVVENLKQTSIWQRVFFTLGFALLFNIVLVPLVILSVLVQVIFVLLTGSANENISAISLRLVAYIHESLLFLLFVSDHKPFPFNDFPEAPVVRTETDESVETVKQPGDADAPRS